MTCIVGIADSGHVYMGADSCASGAGSWMHVTSPKLFIVGGRFLIGCCGSFRAMDLMQHTLKLPEQNTEIGDEAFMRTVFIDAVRKCFRDGGILAMSGGREEGANFLVGYRGRLYEVQPDLSVLGPAAWGHACGTGENAARGSLYTTRGRQDPRKRLILALEAAEAVTPTVRAPFALIELG